MNLSFTLIKFQITTIPFFETFSNPNNLNWLIFRIQELQRNFQSSRLPMSNCSSQQKSLLCRLRFTDIESFIFHLIGTSSFGHAQKTTTHFGNKTYLSFSAPPKKLRTHVTYLWPVVIKVYLRRTRHDWYHYLSDIRHTRNTNTHSSSGVRYSTRKRTRKRFVNFVMVFKTSFIVWLRLTCYLFTSSFSSQNYAQTRRGCGDHQPMREVT